MSTFEEKSPWPSLGYEERPWHSVQDEYGSRTQKGLAAGPYLAAVPAFIADQSISLDSELHALTEEAASELARFDAEVGQIAAPFASVLLRTESASSSEIENLTSGARQIALAELGEHASKNAQLIVGKRLWRTWSNGPRCRKQPGSTELSAGGGPRSKSSSSPVQPRPRSKPTTPR